VGYDPTAAADRREMRFVETPEDIRSLLVMMGQYAVFLPGLERPLPCDELSRALKTNANLEDGFRIHLRGKELPWPSYPRYLWDDAFLH
jgi:hypothetical protein